MTTTPFAPKDAETIKSEIISETGLEYEDNKEMIDKLVARGLKDEEFKASVHKDKMDAREKLKETRKLAGLDPETGEKLGAKASEEPKGGETTPKNEEGLSAKDIVAIRDLHEEDVDFLLEEAKLRKKSVTELKKDPYMQIILKTREEERKTAAMTNTGTNVKGANQPSDEEIVGSAFRENKVPDDPAELARAEMALRKKKIQI